VCIEYDDECVTAAETYSCGREKEPGIVDVIFNSEKGNATIVNHLPALYEYLGKISLLKIFFQYDPPVPCVPFRRIPCQFTKRAPPCVLNVFYQSSCKGFLSEALS
jgi:hypothetical protein